MSVKKAREWIEQVLEVYCWKDKLSHRGVGRRMALQFGECGELRNLARHAQGPAFDPAETPIEF